MKLTSSSVLDILRKFEVAGDENVPRHIENLVVSNPSEHSTLARFSFNTKKYYVLVDGLAEDDTGYMLAQLDDTPPEGVFLENPKDDLMTYGVPYKGKDVYLFQVTSSKRRLDNELAALYPETSRSTWQKHIKAGNVSVNDVAITSVKKEIDDSDSISYNKPENTVQPIDFPVIYKDDNVIVVDKPAGALTHAKGVINEEFTVADFFRQYSTYGKDTNRPGIIHRLDRDTSGVIIGARNEGAAKHLQKQFEKRTTKKVYNAVVIGHPKQDEAIIDLPIGRNPSAPSTFRVDAKGKTAQTYYKILSKNEHHSLIELQPKTGRTHQIRVHMSYIGNPILGDRVYGQEADRLYLHAKSLTVHLPDVGVTTFESPLPAEFTKDFHND